MLGRSKELGTLRGLLDRREPHSIRVRGIRGGGKSSLVRHVLDDYRGLLYRCPPLPEPDQRAGLIRQLDAPELAADAGWTSVTESILERARSGTGPFVLVLDDAHRLTEARARLMVPLARALTEAAATETPLHLVTVGHGPGLPEVDPDAPVVDTEIEVGPLPFRAAAGRLPGGDARGRLRAYGIFGGIPRILEQLDRSVTAGTNVRRLLLPDGAPLADVGHRWLEADVQTPARYYAILRTLARGEADWSTVHAGVPDLTRSGQVAPYLNRLVEMELVETRRSVDAAEGSRSTRYALTDPFFAFWFRFIFPWRLDPPPDRPDDGGGDVYARRIRPGIDTHLEEIFPRLCRQHLVHDAIETLGASAREGGSLWGSGYDLPLAGILTSGSAYYGTSRWSTGAPDRRPDPVQEIDDAVRETRYGFGRERRLRLVFTGFEAPVGLQRRVARRHDATLIGPEELLGSAT